MKSTLEFKLKQFTGTEEWYKHPLFPRYKYTDGIRFLAREGGAYWLIEKILSLQALKKIRECDFQLWRITIHNDKSAVLCCEDGNGGIVYKEVISYTDFPISGLFLYFIDGILLLPSEY